MKKYVILFIIVTTLFSCVVSDNADLNNYKGDEQTYFTEVSLNKDIIATGDGSLGSVEVGSTIKTSSDRSYKIEVDETSTAIDGVDYEFSTDTVTIAGDSFVSNFEFSLLFNTMQDESLLVLNLVEIGSKVSTFKNQITCVLSKQCDPSFVSSLSGGGMYSVSTTYLYNDFLSDYPSNVTQYEITDLGNNTFSVPDFSGGLYSVGPYAAAYGTDGVDNSLVFTDECNKITWEGQSDPWGAIIPLDGGVNKIDPDTGIITISWYCEQYGESGISVYTPL